MAVVGCVFDLSSQTVEVEDLSPSGLLLVRVFFHEIIAAGDDASFMEVRSILHAFRSLFSCSHRIKCTPNMVQPRELETHSGQTTAFFTNGGIRWIVLQGAQTIREERARAL